MKVVAIDLGTNSFLCLIAEVVGNRAERKLTVIQDVSRLVRLGQGVHENRRFHEDALRRASTCFQEFKSIIDNHKPDKIIATATSAARDVANGSELLEMGRRYGIPISIIPGQKEAELSFAGAMSGVSTNENETVALIDVGGGSTELALHKKEMPLVSHSFDIGAVRMTEMFFSNDPADLGQLEALLKHSRSVFSSFKEGSADLVVAVAGTPTTIACVKKGIDFVESEVEGSLLSGPEILDLAKRLCAMPIAEREKVPGLPALRADVIVSGAVILFAAMEKLGAKQVYVSTRGLRFGAALDYESF